MPCNCNYSLNTNLRCVTCVNGIAADKTVTQKRIWQQVRTASSTYTMNLASFTGGAAILASNNTANWNQMSDRVLAATQPSLNPTNGNSLRSTLTSGRPGAATPGGSGVDVKHDSYARYLNKKKAGNLKTQTNNVAAKPLYGNKTNATGLVADNIKCCA